MPVSASSLHSLRRTFQQGFTVQDIAEPLISFDAQAPAARIKDFMEAKRFEVVGIRRDGLVAGFVVRSELRDGECDACMRPFESTRVIAGSMPLAELVLRLRERPRLFVSSLGQINGIVSRSDLQKPAVRMWLFGIVTLIEMRFTRLIEQVLPDQEWQTELSEGRLEKARAFQAERRRTQQELDLLDCLQLCDKAQIVARNEHLRGMTQLESKRQVEEVTKVLEHLRNNLAHSQDIVTNDWDAIVMLAERLDGLLERAGRPEQFGGDG